MSQLATLERQSIDSTAAYKAMFEHILETKTITQLSETEPRLVTKDEKQVLESDIKYLLYGKHFDQFMREVQHYSGLKIPKTVTEHRGFERWLKANKPHLLV